MHSPIINNSQGLVNFIIEPVCWKNSKTKFLTSEGIIWFQTDRIWVQVIPLIIQDQFYTIRFRIFRGPLSHKPLTGQDFFCCCFLQQTGSSGKKNLKASKSRKQIMMSLILSKNEYYPECVLLLRFTDIYHFKPFWQMLYKI